MPELKEYVNTQGLAPTDRGTEAATFAGRRLGQFFNQRAESLRDFGNRTAQNIGSAVRDAGNVAADYVTHREISQGIATYAQMQDDLTTRWNDLAKNADPNDPSVRQEFIEKTLTPTLQKWGETFNTEGGQKWAQSRTAALLDHMYEKSAADMGSMAAKALDTNIRTFTNTQTHTAYEDASAVSHLIETNNASIDAMVGSSNLKGTDAARARIELAERSNEQIAKAGGIGAVERSSDPKAAAEQYIRKNSKYLSEAAQERIRSHAEEQVRARRVDQTYADHLAKVERQDISDQAETGYLQKLFSDDPKERSSVTTRAIVNDPNLTKQAKEHFVNIVERETKPAAEARISAKTTMDMLPDIRSGKIASNDPINKAFGDGKLTRSDFNFLRNELADLKTDAGQKLSKDRTDFFQKFAPSIDIGKNPNILGSTSALGQLRIYQAEQDARRQEGVLRQAGKDPHLVYDNRSEYFFGRPENLRKYQPTLKEITDYEAGLRKGGATAPAGPKFEPFVEAPNATFNQRFGFDAAATVQGPSVGMVRTGNGGIRYRFKGGDQFKRESWEKVD